MTAVVPGRRADPVVKAPRPPQWSQHWANWFLNEVEPLFHSAMETSADYRRKWTRDSPLRFALTYLEDPHLRLQDSDPPLITFNEMHLSLCVAAKRWMEPKRWREGWVAPRGVGKALALDTPVLTVDRGWTTHGDLRVGDRVFDERGVPCNVVRVSERWTDRPCYRLTFSDGEQIVADERHEWWVNDRYSALGERTVETERIAEKWLLTEARGRREVRYSVPVFRLPRKLARIATRVRAAGNRRIVDVERVENQSTSCIEVDSPSHLYLVGRALIPTHNSSWCFLALPLWALAHGHRSYFMAFSADAGMAQNQLANLRQELDPKNGNAKLLGDYPELALRKGFGGSNTKATVVANGGTIAAAGLGQNTLGRKSGANRPDLIILDDIEPLDETMSDREKRSIILDITAGVIPMASPQAAIGIFGTTTSYGSVIHDLAQHARGRERVDWVENNEITPRLFPGIRIDPDTGEERSLWPERWPLTETHLGEWLRRTVDGRIPDEFMRNFLLDPTVFGDEAGSFWRPELIQHKDYRRVPGIVEHALYLDVAVTATRSADQTAAVIVGKHPKAAHATVEYAEAWNISPDEIHRRVKRLVERYPTVRTVIVENNQGGDLWLDVVSPSYDPLPRHVRLETEHVRTSKRDRVADALRHYERGAVFHCAEFVDLERQMVLFPSPKSRDDLVDALTGGLRWAFNDPANRRLR